MVRWLGVTFACVLCAACSGKVVDRLPSGDGRAGGDSGAGGDATCDVAETCDDGLDNDCNGSNDDGCGCTENDTVGCGTDQGECLAGLQTCTGGTWGTCTGGRGPAEETCDGLDNDCDGDVDEDCPCQGTATQPCGSDIGECVPGTQTCNDGRWGPCQGGVGSVAELCDGLDNDCDNVGDNGLNTRPAANHAGECVDNIESCDGSNGWVADASNYVPVAEVCDGLDNDCANGVDDGLATRPVANVEGECVDNIENCEGSNGWVADAGNYVPVAEVCDGLDNDCAAGVDDGLTTRPAANIEGECVDNIENCEGSNRWVADAGNYVPVAEICGDALDSDCDGADDDGCDDDNDGYCDASLQVAVDNPAVCANSTMGAGDDCDDAEADAFPGNDPEICTDGIDNNCDGLTDLEDEAVCPAIDVYVASSDPIRLHHGEALDNQQANIDPVDSGLVWTRVWEITGAAGNPDCGVGDIHLDNQQDDTWRTRIRITDAVDDVSRLGCTYTLTVTVNGYATDSVQIVLVNDPPELLSITGAVFDGSAWLMTLPAGSTPTITANAWDAEADDLLFEWSGADADSLSCAEPCASTDSSPGFATVSWDGLVAPGAYLLTVELMDDFDPLQRVFADIIIEVDNCLWVIQGGSGSGDGSTPGNAMDSIHAALDGAVGVADTDVCVLGSGTFAEDLVLPASLTNAPDLLGGFTNLGLPDAVQQPTVQVGVNFGVTFDPGYDGMVKNIRFEQTAFAPGIPDPSVLTIQDASPTLLNCWVNFSVGAQPVGIAIHSTDSLVSTAPVINGGLVEPAGVVDDATAIRVSEAVGGDATATIINLDSVNTGSGLYAGGSGTHFAILLMPGVSAEIAGNSLVNATSDDGAAIGIYVTPAARASIHDNDTIRGNGAVLAMGVKLEGTGSLPARATIERNYRIEADSASAAPTAKVGIAITDNDGTAIRDNGSIVSTSFAGTVIDAGISDGMIQRDGTTSYGSSTNLEISGNAEIRGGGFVGNRGTCAEGPDVTVGVLLVGTTNSTISDNGRPSAPGTGIVGGTTSVHWAPAIRRLIPSSPGLWLIDTTGITVADNEIRSGGLWLDAAPPLGCTIVQPPAAIAYRDGVPANPDSGGAAFGASHATWFTRNGAACELPMQSAVAPGAMETWCVAVELNQPIAGEAPILSNNVLAATRGNTLVSLRQRGGSGVGAINNTLDTDLTLLDSELDLVPSDTVIKWPVLLEGIDAGGITLINNILAASNDRAPTGDRDLDLERICVVDIVPDSSAGSSVGLLQSSLFYIEDNIDSDPYVRVTDGTTGIDYDAGGLNAIAGAVTSGNFVDLPGLSPADTDWEKSSMRLVPGSAAINAGSSGGAVPAVDMDGDARPDTTSGLVDIGHDEMP